MSAASSIVSTRSSELASPIGSEVSVVVVVTLALGLLIGSGVAAS